MKFSKRKRWRLTNMKIYDRNKNKMKSTMTAKTSLTKLYNNPIITSLDSILYFIVNLIIPQTYLSSMDRVHYVQKEIQLHFHQRTVMRSLQLWNYCTISQDGQLWFLMCQCWAYFVAWKDNKRRSLITALSEIAKHVFDNNTLLKNK